MNDEELLIEYWAWHYDANPNVEEVEDEEFDLDAIQRRMEESPDDWVDA